MDAIKASPALQRMLLTGGLVAGAAGGSTLAGARDKNETPWQHRLRALRNAVGAGTLAGGAEGLMEQGYGHLARPLPVDAVDPVAKGVHDLTHGYAARGAAMAGTAAWPIMSAKGETATAQESIRALLQSEAAKKHMEESGLSDYASSFINPNSKGHTTGLGELFHNSEYGTKARQAMQAALASGKGGAGDMSKVEGMLRDAGIGGTFESGLGAAGAKLGPTAARIGSALDPMVTNLGRGAERTGHNLFTNPEEASGISTMLPRALRGPAILAAAFAPEIASKGMDLIGRGVSSNFDSTDPTQAPTS